MKDGRFENTKELYQALLEGKKVTSVIKGTIENYYVYFDENGEMKEHPENPSGAKLNCISMGEAWKIYEEPKPKKKVTLYRYTYHCQHRGIVIQTWWSTEVWVYRQDNDPLLLVESKEIEVDDV